MTQEFLNDILHYEPSTGRLYWRQRTIDMFKDGKQPAKSAMNRWNANNAGKEAFLTPHSAGYVTSGILGITCYGHRVIWKMVHGVDAKQIDHINGNKSDNRIVNLRSVSNSENQKNSAKSSNNTSGVCGVYLNKTLNKWCANISVDYKTISLGLYDDFNVAVVARKVAERKYGFHKNHGREAKAS
ncbi:MAG: hypothetical protein GY943_07520 [Chloroflexi bacterium]|nr:hypothetical protein [Chloroflexota bacterium]